MTYKYITSWFFDIYLRKVQATLVYGCIHAFNALGLFNNSRWFAEGGAAL